jgi:hypothetical protein
MKVINLEKLRMDGWIGVWVGDGWMDVQTFD